MLGNQAAAGLKYDSVVIKKKKELLCDVLKS